MPADPLSTACAIVLYNSHVYSESLASSLVQRLGPSKSDVSPAAPQQCHVGGAARRRRGQKVERLAAGGALTPPSGVSPRSQWQPEQLQILLRCLKSAPPNACIQQATADLGWADLPDPDGKIRNRVKFKLFSMKRRLAAGGDPLETGTSMGGVIKQKYNWREWFRKAFLSLRNGEGTMDDVAALIEADPKIAPKLDMGSVPSGSKAPRWRRNMAAKLHGYPEIVKTGQKRGRFPIYRYDNEIAERLRKKRDKPRKSRRHS